MENINLLIFSRKEGAGMIAAYSENLSSSPTSQVFPNGREPREMQTPDMVECIKSYAKKNPEKFAMWCFGLGFVLGWRLKPW